jgi:hypothetical protein
MDCRASVDYGLGVQNEEIAWADERWWCGTPNEWCRFCGKLVSFAPECLQIDRCQCDRAPGAEIPAPSLTRAIRVRMARAVRFNVPVSLASAAIRTTARPGRYPSGIGEKGPDSTFKLSGRNSSGAERGLPLAGSDGNPAPRVRRLRDPHAPPPIFSAKPKRRKPPAAGLPAA